MSSSLIEAWVLWARPYGEHDYLACLYSRERGKLNAYIKGIRKMKSKMRSSIVPFSRAQFKIHVNPRSQWVKVIGVTPVSFHPSLHMDMLRIIDASWVCELLDRFTPLEQTSTGKYEILSKALERIASAKNYRMVRIIFGLSLIEHSGHGMSLDHCIECRRAVVPEEHVFISYAGYVCGGCRQTTTRALRIEYSIFRLLAIIKKDPWLLETWSLNRVELDSLVNVTNFVLGHYLQRPLKADTFKNKIQQQVAK